MYRRSFSAWYTGFETTGKPSHDEGKSLRSEEGFPVGGGNRVHKTAFQ